ncbi:aldehyde-activating protein [Erythrobacter sp. SG61-1L]|uniref:GFA family protein n=1 Tax=Erythrobacter sp. SG61-1L TaxID=1603897 RepID=UPI0006C92265|nr:GFA family protein [Erythrobacter sp. SG61-1L]KPL67860.1 aldehyde-activating protein [Erythrobacter sp. SG61-1L]
MADPLPRSETREARCLCGALRAEVAANAQPMTVLCHCRDCQRRSGSAFGITAYFPQESVSISGEAREFTRPTDEGNIFTTGFCPQCGSTLYARPSKYPGILGVTVGTFADPEFPRPARSVYEQSKHDWIGLPEDMPRHPRGRDS